MTTTLSKADLRAAALGKRDALSDEQRAAAAQPCKAARPFEIAPGRSFPDIRRSATRSTAPLMRHLAGLGAKLALPVVLARGKSLGVSRLVADDRLMLGPLGIRAVTAAAAVIPDIMRCRLRRSTVRVTARLWRRALRLQRGASAQGQGHHRHRHRLCGAGNKSGSGQPHDVALDMC